MVNTIRIIVLVLVPATVLSADFPDWVANHGKSLRYPDATFLVGYGIAQERGEVDRTRCMQLATDHGKRNLVEKIRLTIQNTVISKSVEHDNTISSYFSTATQSTSALELQGLEVEMYYNDIDKTCHALVFVNREKLERIYRVQASRLREGIRDHLVAGKRNEEANERTKALDEYLACYPLFRRLEEAEAVITALPGSMMTTFAELEASIKNDQASVGVVRQAVDRVIRKPLATIEDLCWYLVYCLKKQVGTDVKSVLVAPFMYQDTRMGSSFSRFFGQTLQSKVVEIAQWEVVQGPINAQPRSGDRDMQPGAAGGQPYVLTGTYWEQPHTTRFTAVMRRLSDGAIVASTEALIAGRVVRATRLNIKPENFKEALSDQRQFRKDEVIGGGLGLEVWTNKGVDNLLYTKGEEMQVFVKVNMPCYIRLIDHLADRKRALLLDNYYIDDSKVNMVYQLPSTFECDAPFGAEVLQAFARTEKFPPLETNEFNGLDILREDLPALLVTTRAMKKTTPGALQAESRLLLTTIDK
jgi:hypothetical protein